LPSDDRDFIISKGFVYEMLVGLLEKGVVMQVPQVRLVAGDPRELLQSGRVGHLATISPRGRVSTIPIAFYFDGLSVFFGTPKESPKLRFLEENPNVAFQIDNGKVMEEAVGIMIQGRAEIYHVQNLVRKYRETLPAILSFSRKYPDVFTFYTRDYKKLPDDRKFHRYRLIRIVPDRILFWSGYEWGRLVPDPQDYAPFFDIHADVEPKAMAREVESLLASLDSLSTEERPGENILDKGEQLRYPKLIDQDELMSELFAEAMADQKVTEDEIEILNTIRANYRFYLDSLSNAMSDGVISKDECALLNTIKKSVYQSTVDTALKDGEIGTDEARLLKKFGELLNVAETAAGQSVSA
jgi:nitroimidazol reductase NimA-like FMN-containing flavoprotein (pyridoxamine 5'-phosphate oxidase superfamily)